LTVPRTPQQNGRAERKIQTVVNLARVFRLSNNLPAAAWVKTLVTAAVLENLLPSTVNPGQKSPAEMILGKTPNISHLRPIGTAAVVHVDHNDPAFSKFGPACLEGILIGFSSVRKAWRILLSTSTGKVIESDRVKFFDRPFDTVPRIEVDSSEREVDYSEPLYLTSPPAIAPAAVPAAAPAAVSAAAPAAVPVVAPVRASTRDRHAPMRLVPSFQDHIYGENPLLVGSMTKELTGLIGDQLELLPEGARDVDQFHLGAQDQEGREQRASSCQEQSLSPGVLPNPWCAL
jgi:hypothetical protein